MVKYSLHIISATFNLKERDTCEGNQCLYLDVELREGTELYSMLQRCGKSYVEGFTSEQITPLQGVSTAVFKNDLH